MSNYETLKSKKQRPIHEHCNIYHANGSVSNIPDSFHAVFKIILDRPSVYNKTQRLPHDIHIRWVLRRNALKCDRLCIGYFFKCKHLSLWFSWRFVKFTIKINIKWEESKQQSRKGKMDYEKILRFICSLKNLWLCSTVVFNELLHDIKYNI